MSGDGVVYVLGAPKWAYRDLRRADEVIADVRADVSFETRWLDASVGRLWRLRVDLDWVELRSDAGALELVTGSARRVSSGELVRRALCIAGRHRSPRDWRRPWLPVRVRCGLCRLRAASRRLSGGER